MFLPLWCLPFEARLGFVVLFVYSAVRLHGFGLEVVQILNAVDNMADSLKNME